MVGGSGCGGFEVVGIYNFLDVGLGAPPGTTAAPTFSIHVEGLIWVVSAFTVRFSYFQSSWVKLQFCMLLSLNC